jgi:hypothetical protein
MCRVNYRAPCRGRAARLRRLEEQLPAHVGRRACQDRRGRLVLVTSRREPDGSMVRWRIGPPRVRSVARCPNLSS